MRSICFFILFILYISPDIFAIDGVLVQTIDYNFKDKWDNTSSLSAPKITTCNTILKRQYFYLTPIVKDFDITEDNKANIVYSIKILKPDRSEYFSQNDIPLMNDIIKEKSFLQRANSVLKICFEQEDVLGEYSIYIDVFDKISGNVKKMESKITLVDNAVLSNQIDITNDQNFDNWMSGYFENPHPEKALTYYLNYINSEDSEKDSSIFPIIGFFSEIIKNNSFLIPIIESNYAQQDLRTKIFLLYLLFYSGNASDIFIQSLAGDEYDVYLKLAEAENIFEINTEVQMPEQLDILWGTFFAGGGYAPILKLIQGLEYAEYIGALQNYKDSKKTEEDLSKAIKESIYQALVWSLKSNIEQHKLVFLYCYWAYKYEDLNELQKSELKQILQSKSKTIPNSDEIDVDLNYTL